MYRVLANNCVHAWSRTRAYIHMDRYEYAAACGEIALSGLDIEENRLWSWSNFVIVRGILLRSARENLLRLCILVRPIVAGYAHLPG